MWWWGSGEVEVCLGLWSSVGTPQGAATFLSPSTYAAEQLTSFGKAAVLAVVNQLSYAQPSGTEVLQSSSRAASLFLESGATDGTLWQKDYFDRLIRDGEHFWNCVRYIRHNPVKGKLRESEYSLYLSEEVQHGLGAGR